MTLQQICLMITTMKNILYRIIAQQKDFMGELSVYEQSWWERDDVSTYDNKALDEKELHDVRMKLLEAEDILERDFRTIEEEVKAHPSTTNLQNYQMKKN